MVGNGFKLESEKHCDCRILAPLLIQRKQAAGLLGISLRAIDYLTAAGRIRTRRIGGRVLIAYKEIERFANSDSRVPMVPPKRLEAAA